MKGYPPWSREVFTLDFFTLRYEEIDWACLRAAAVAIGIRRAARQAAARWTRAICPASHEAVVRARRGWSNLNRTKPMPL